MRAAAIAALLVSLPLTASADPAPFKHDVIWGKPPVHAAGAKQFTAVSHTLYLNNCLPNGCNVHPGNDNSLTNTSSIAEGNVTLDAWAEGDQAWQTLVSCVTDTFAPFDINIVTTDPGPSVDHFTVMVGGRALQLNSQLQGAGGVAPFVVCDGELEDDVISFVFSGEGGNNFYWCGAIAQESSHVWGLDHEMDANDPMTYMDLGSHKTFQDHDVSCGEFSNRACTCGNPTQNSKQYLIDIFGPKTLTPGAVTITKPVDGQWVKPGFAIKGTVDSQLTLTGNALSIDNAAAGTAAGAKTFSFTAPTTLAGGDHMVTVTAADVDRTFSGTVSVKVTASCANGEACADGTLCLGGNCLPNADTAGGLGSVCGTNDDCVTGACGDDTKNKYCTDSCDAGKVCPSGFDCIDDGAAGVCWPGSGGGGCDAGGGGAGLAMFGAGAIVLALRRRKR